MADKETVTLKLPSGESVDFVVPGGMSDDAIKSLALSKRPDLFQKASPAPPSFLDAANQSKQQFMTKSPLAPTERAMQQTMGGPPMFVDVPKGQKQSFEQAGQRGYQTGGKIGAASLTIPSLIAAPVATALGIGGSLVGGYAGKLAGKKGAEALGASPDTAEMAGDVGGMVGGVAGGAGMALSPFAKWLGASKTLGAKMLQLASSKAGTAPVELSPQTNELVEKIVEQGKLGGKVPKVISDLLERVGPSARQPAEANPGPLTYNEARILQSNASDSSANEKLDLKGALRYLMPKFARSFSGDVQAAADQAGVGAEHALGMKEYAQASARNKVVGNVAKAAGVGAATAAGGYGILKLLKNLTP